MAAIKIKDGIYSVGVLNPNLRVFDIVMKTDYGTSYNAYIIKREKTVLVETCHERFFDAFMENISEVTDVRDIDYIVLNHTEPDHAGCLERILAINPEITVISTVPASKYLRGICNTDFKSITVKDGQTIDIGQCELKFITAPFLHWPDSMFTYVESEKTVFTCDFLGCHYCEPLMFDDAVAYKSAYDDALLCYYNDIFSPFKKNVLDGLAKLGELNADIICPSHGPVLRSGADEVISKYENWSKAGVKEGKNIVIAYVSAYGYTRALAEELAKGAREAGAQTHIYDIIACDTAEVLKKIDGADGIMLGSPTINRDALPPVMNLLNGIGAIKNRGKAVLAFGSYGWSGEAVDTIGKRAETLGLKPFGDSFKVNFKPTPDDLQKAQSIGREFAEAL